MYIGIQAVLALYASGRTTGIVLDCGDGNSSSPSSSFVYLLLYSCIYSCIYICLFLFIFVYFCLFLFIFVYCYFQECVTQCQSTRDTPFRMQSGGWTWEDEISRSILFVSLRREAILSLLLLNVRYAKEKRKQKKRQGGEEERKHGRRVW